MLCTGTPRGSAGGVAAAALLAAGLLARGADQPQWGERYTRNMVSAEKDLPSTFDPETGENVLWAVQVGTETYSTPVVAGGRVFIGTNNHRPHDPRLTGDRGVLLCLDARDGAFIWQLALVKRGPSPYWDWPRCGMVSPATVDGDRVYMVTNRGEVVCLDMNGMADGNDGPYTDEARLMALKDGPPIEPGPTDADVVWLYDLTKEAGVRQHDSAHSSFLIHDGFIYMNTSNGLDDAHQKVENPEAPSLVVFEKKTGRLVAREREGIGHRTFHSTWASPSLGEAGGRTLVFFGGGDGVLYAFEALKEVPSGELPASLKLVWKCDMDPDAPRENVHSYIRNRTESPSNIKGIPVFHDGRVFVAYGGDVWWGKRQAWLSAVDASGEGDVTRRAVVWTHPLEQHSMSTPAVADGLVYIADCGGKIHCVEESGGRPVWTHDAGSDMWSSPLVADGKMYIGTRRGVLWILAAGREKRVLASVRLDAPINGSAVAAGGVVYVPSMKTLYALKQGVPATR